MCILLTKFDMCHFLVHIRFCPGRQNCGSSLDADAISAKKTHEAFDTRFLFSSKAPSFVDFETGYICALAEIVNKRIRTDAQPSPTP